MTPTKIKNWLEERPAFSLDGEYAAGERPRHGFPSPFLPQVSMALAQSRGRGPRTHVLRRFRTFFFFRIEFQGHENVAAKCLETSPRNVSRKRLREKRFSDEQGRIRHTGVSSSFHRTLRLHEMQVLRFHRNSTQSRSLKKSFVCKCVRIQCGWTHRSPLGVSEGPS